MSVVLRRLRGLLPSDPTEMRVALFMLGGSIVMGLLAWLLARSNARLQRRIEQKRRDRRAEADAARQAVDALPGRTGAAGCECTDTDLRS
jgi:biopolymer transport protein ExbB/TolQ